MGVADQRLCCCYKERQEFHKIVDLKDLVVYCHTTCREDQVVQGGMVGSAVSASQDVFILHNTKNVKITPAEFIPALEKSEISCPRCRKIYEHAKELLQNVKSIDKKNVMGVCDHCLRKAQSKRKPCTDCDEILKKFLLSKDDHTDETKKCVKLWLSKMKALIQDTVDKPKKIKARASSELQIERLCQYSARSIRQPEVEQMFHSEIHKSDTNLHLKIRDVDEREHKQSKYVIFNDALEPLETSYPTVPYKKGIISTMKAYPPYAGSDITIAEPMTVKSKTDDNSGIEVKDSMKKRESQKHIIYEIAKIAPWEQQVLQDEQDESETNIRKVVLKVKSDLSLIPSKTSQKVVKKVDISEYYDDLAIDIKQARKHDPSLKTGSEPRGLHPLIKLDKHTTSRTSQRELKESRRKKEMIAEYKESVIDVKGATKRKHDLGSKHMMEKVVEPEHPYSEQYRLEKDAYSKSRKAARDTEEIPKKLMKRGDGHITDDDLQLQRSVPTLSHEKEKPGKLLGKASIKSRKTIKYEEDTIENILQKQFSYFFPKSKEKKQPKLAARSSQLIKNTQEKLRLQAEKEKLERERKKREETERINLEREEKRRLAEEKKKKSEEKKGIAEEQKKHDEAQKKLEEERHMKKTAEEESEKKFKSEERKRSERKSKTDELTSKSDQQEKKSEGSKKDIKVQTEPKGKIAKEMEKEKKGPKEKPELKDKIEEIEKGKKGSKVKPETKAKDRVDETEKAKGELSAKTEPKAKPEPKTKPELKEKIEETEKGKKDSKAKSEPKDKPDVKNKIEETEKAKKDVKAKSELKTKLEDTEKAKLDAKAKSAPKVTSDLQRDKAEGTGKAKLDTKSKSESKVTPDKDKAEASVKTKKDLKAKPEATVTSDLKSKEEMEKAKTDLKAKPDSKDTTDLKSKEEMEKTKKDLKAKPESKDTSDIKRKEEMDKAKKDLKAKPESKDTTDLKSKEEIEKAKKDLKAKPESKDTTDLKSKEEIEKAKKDQKAKPKSKDTTDLESKVEEMEKAKKDLKAKPESEDTTGLKSKEEMEKAKKDQKAKPESKTTTDLESKVEEMEKAKKDLKAKPESKDTTHLKSKEEIEKAKKDQKAKPESKYTTDLESKVVEMEKAKKDLKAKPESKDTTDLKSKEEIEKAKKDQKAIPESKDTTDLESKVEEMEKAKKDLKAKPESKDTTDLKSKAEMEKAKKDQKAKPKSKDTTDLESKVEEMEKVKKGLKAKPESKDTTDFTSKVDEIEKAKRDLNAKSESKDTPDIKGKIEETGKAKKDLKAKSESKDTPGIKGKVEETETAKKDLKEKPESKASSGQKDKAEEIEKSKQDKKAKLAPKVRSESGKDSEKESGIESGIDSAKDSGKESEKEKNLKVKPERKDAVEKETEKGKKGLKEKSETKDQTADVPAKTLKEKSKSETDKSFSKSDEKSEKEKAKKDQKQRDQEEKEVLKQIALKLKDGQKKAMSASDDVSIKMIDKVPKEKESSTKTKETTKQKPSKETEESAKLKRERSPKDSSLKDKPPRDKSSKDKPPRENEEPREEKTVSGTSRKTKDGAAEEAQFRKLQAQLAKEKEEAQKRRRQEEAEMKKIRDLAEKKAKEATANVAPFREAKATIKPEPVRAPKVEKKKKEVSVMKDLKMNQVKVYNPSVDDLILRLVRIKQASVDQKIKEQPFGLDPAIIKAHKCHHQSGQDSSNCDLCNNSELEMDVESYEYRINVISDTPAEIIIGEHIYKYRPQVTESAEVVPLLFQSTFRIDPVPSPKKPIGQPIVQAIPALPEPEKKPFIFTKELKGVEPEPGKGIIRYALSDRTFIDKGWTMLPTEKVVRKMNVYRMRPAHPEFDWFEHNKNKRLMSYDGGEKLAEFDDNGRGRWFYRNGRLALDYYDAEETNAQQRFVIYSSGEPDERGRSHPITILATFDYLGNGIVFDHSGKIRLKYNQTEGVVLDRGIGPVSHWKWHTLNDPPVLQQVMIDTQMAHKDPQIIKLGTAADNKTRPDNEEMLAIEFDNFIKEKSKKLSQKFKPFQIKMKALKINEHFSLKVLDQATVYLIFRDGSTNLKLNIGMILDHQEIVDTDTAEVGEVSNNLERFPARTDSLAALQRSVAYAQRYERTRTERERRLRPPEPCGSADHLTAAASAPLRPPLRTVPTGSTVSSENCTCRKPTNNLYYNTRLL